MASSYSIIRRVIRSVGLGGAASRLQFLIPDRVVTRDVDRLGRFTFRLRRHRWLLGAPLFASGHHAETIAMFRRLIPPGGVVYDIGANIGYYARLIAQEMSPSAVICFEPMRENADLLEANAALAPAGIVRVFRLALADHAGDELLQVDDVMGGTAVLDAVAGGRPAEARQHLGLAPKAERVRVARLDDVVEAERLPPPALLKIDTEGAEALVIRGALATLRAHRPRLAIALHGEAAGRETIALLGSAGYTCFGQRSDAVGHTTVTADDAGRLADNNIVALPAGDALSLM